MCSSHPLLPWQTPAGAQGREGSCHLFPSVLLCAVSDILQTWPSSTRQQAPAERSCSHSQDVFIHYSAENRQGTPGTSWQANKLSSTSLSKLRFNLQFLASLRAQSLLKLEFAWPDFSLVGFPMSKCHVKADFTSRKNFTSLLIILHANMQRGNNPLGHLPSSLLLEEHALLGNAKSGRQSVGVIAVFVQEHQRLCPTMSAWGSKQTKKYLELLGYFLKQNRFD